MNTQLLTFVGVATLLTLTPGADTMLVIRNVLMRGRGAGLLTAAGICSGLFCHATLSALGLSIILVHSAVLYEVVKFLGACYLCFLGYRSLRQTFRTPRGNTAQIRTGVQDGDRRARTGASRLGAGRDRQTKPLSLRHWTPRSQSKARTPYWSGIVLKRRAVIAEGPNLLVPAESSYQGSSWRRSIREGFLSNILNPKVAVFYLAFLPQFINAGDPVLAKSLLLAGIHFVLGIVWLSLVTVFVGWLRAWLARPAIRRALEAVTGVVLIGFGVRLALEKR